MGRQFLMRDVHNVSCQVESKLLRKYHSQAIDKGQTMAEFIRSALEYYSGWIDGNNEANEDITLDPTPSAKAILTSDPQAESTPISDILNYKK